MRNIIAIAIIAVALVGCTSTGWNPPPGTQITVTGGGNGDITGTVTVPVPGTTNVDIGGTITGNPNTGQVSGGLVIVFKSEPSITTKETMVAGGMQPLNSRTWLLLNWTYKDKDQGAALQAALREGATLLRPGAEVKFRVNGVQ